VTQTLGFEPPPGRYPRENAQNQYPFQGVIKFATSTKEPTNNAVRITPASTNLRGERDSKSSRRMEPLCTPNAADRALLIVFHQAGPPFWEDAVFVIGISRFKLPRGRQKDARKRGRYHFSHPETGLGLWYPSDLVGYWAAPI
jgi:hypothetical protein